MDLAEATTWAAPESKSPRVFRLSIRHDGFFQEASSVAPARSDPVLILPPAPEQQKPRPPRPPPPPGNLPEPPPSPQKPPTAVVHLRTLLDGTRSWLPRSFTPDQLPRILCQGRRNRRCAHLNSFSDSTFSVAQTVPSFAAMSDKPPSAFVAENNAGHGQPFTKGRRPVSLAFVCDVSTDRFDAIGVVWVVRQLSRSAKARLCNGCPDILQRVLARGRGVGAKLRRTRGN